MYPYFIWKVLKVCFQINFQTLLGQKSLDFHPQSALKGRL